MTNDQLTAVLAERFLGWKTAPDRFMKGSRSWTPRWRFRPFEDPADAIALLERAADDFSLTRDKGLFTARVQIGEGCGIVSGKNIARSVTTAVCRALQMKV